MEQSLAQLEETKRFLQSQKKSSCYSAITQQQVTAMRQLIEALRPISSEEGNLLCQAVKGWLPASAEEALLLCISSKICPTDQAQQADHEELRWLPQCQRPEDSLTTHILILEAGCGCDEDGSNRL